MDDKGKDSELNTLETNYAFGEPIYSPADGIVIEVHDGEIDGEFKTRSPKANYIEIDHGNNIVSRLVHLKNGSIKVSVGDSVKSGQEIASIGKSGTTDPHLHFGFQRYIIDSSGEKKSVPIPVLLSNYFVSWNQGIGVHIEKERPRRGQFIRND